MSGPEPDAGSARMRYVCIHGHFYQPPRENPWLERIDLQESAAPYHDWNERITRECYKANSAARILDGADLIVKIANNYERINFNFGPTLLSWMQRRHPQIHAAIVEGDRRSVERFGGHGSAIAQAYHHMILPLACRRDKVTQVIWGRRDFESRFGRSPEGMWLPETAVDLESLDILADQGIRYTILAPHQARRVRRIGDRKWLDLDNESALDTTIPYRVELPSGNNLALFFYNGPISRAVAFEGILHSGARFTERLMGAFPESAGGEPLVHIATDGESYGHHHAFGEMALAYALDAIDSSAQTRLTNYGQHLEHHPPTHEVEIAELTSWSCAHGVERWRSDCGCRINPMSGWSQEWREPLRNALNWLRDELAAVFEQGARGLLRDPWRARDEYVGLILDRSEEAQRRFLDEHCDGQLADDEVVRSLQLLEMQHHAMLMFTSCGWFFDDLAGIETVQILQYAARAMQLADTITSERFEARFLELLEPASSNNPKRGDGRQIYDDLVRPAKVDMSRVAAHSAMMSVFDDLSPGEESPSYSIDFEARESTDVAGDRIDTGRVRIRSASTLQQGSRGFIVLHRGGVDLHCGVFAAAEAERSSGLSEDLGAALRHDDRTRIEELIEQHPDIRAYSFRDLFLDEQQRILDSVVDTARQEAEAAARHLFQKHLASIRLLDDPAHPLSRALQVAAELTINADLRAGLASEPVDLVKVRRCLEDATSWQVSVDEVAVARDLENAAERAARGLAGDFTDVEQIHRLREIVEVGRSLKPPVVFWDLQSSYYRWLRSLPEDRLRQLGGNNDATHWSREARALGQALSIRLPG
jgi:alpha-amylase/alpha-mannosidase (GH57 family)